MCPLVLAGVGRAHGACGRGAAAAAACRASRDSWFMTRDGAPLRALSPLRFLRLRMGGEARRGVGRGRCCIGMYETATGQGPRRSPGLVCA